MSTLDTEEDTLPEDFTSKCVYFSEFSTAPKTEQEALESWLAPFWTTHAEIDVEGACVWYSNKED